MTTARFSVLYMDKKGAGCSRVFFSEEALLRFIARLRTEARIYRDDVHIGDVFRSDGADDRRIKWMWSIEKTA